MSEENMMIILDGVEGVYRNHKRNGEQTVALFNYRKFTSYCQTLPLYSPS